MRSLLLSIVLVVWSSADVFAIRGGTVVPATEGRAAVWFTATGYRYSGSCSGVLVTPTKVLTAAHCVRTRKGTKLRVRRARIGNPRGKTIRARVVAVHVHSDYKPKLPSRGSDFAVLVLKRPVKGIAPIPMAEAGDDPSQGTRVFVHGFGLTRRGRRLVSSSNRLRMAKLHFLSPFACFSGPVKKMAVTRMCAASPSQGVCPGDSGSGVTRTSNGKTVVVGIVSVVLDSGRCNRGPTIMGRVSAFAAWVRAIGKP